MMACTVVMVALLLPRLAPVLGRDEYIIPKGFYIGAATSSYQIEGAWNVDGKGESIWDRYTQQHPEAIQDHSNGNLADKSYYLYKEDIKALKNLNMNMYRFSISWPRIMPKGLMNEINLKGINYYNTLIDELLENGIEPMVTMYHWELPQHLQDLGGWANEAIVGYFGEYARVLYKYFGDRVKYWVTINEPSTIIYGYQKTSNLRIAPDIDSPGVGLYLVARNLLKAHALAYHIYDKEFRNEYNGKLSIAINWIQGYPRNPNSTEDIEATERMFQFFVGLFTNPVYGANGDYPELVKDRVAKNSEKEGFPESRLVTLTKKEIAFISGTTDFCAFNYYTSKVVEYKVKGPTPSFQRDMGVELSNKPTLPVSDTTPWLVVDPRCVYDAIKDFKNRYGNKEIIITECGYSDDGRIDDDERILYLTSYLINVLRVMYQEKANVKGFLTWSIIDNFEWSQGYTAHFGLYQVNMTDPRRKRVPKKSCEVMKNIIDSKVIKSVYYDLEEQLYA